MILHVDMDAFYASIEQRDRPELRGKPVIVGGSQSGRGVVSAASYEAREYGVHSAMPASRAAKLCPHAVFVRTRMEQYARVAREIRDIFHRFTPLVQPLALDEAFLDVRGCERLFGDAATIGKRIREAIEGELALTASVGVAPMKFVAKIASDIDKPNGFVVVNQGEVIPFLDPLPIKRLWGVGKVGQRRLDSMGLRTIGDIRTYDRQLLETRFGAWGSHLWNLANAIDPRGVTPDHTAKQISHERTFADDLSDENILRAVVSHLSEQVCRRLRRHQRKCKTVTLKYRREDFQTFSKSQSLSMVTDSTSQIMEVSIELLNTMRRQEPRPVRLIGVSLGNLTGMSSPQQLSLFDLSQEGAAQKSLDGVVDQLSERVGGAKIYRATSHDWIHRKRKPS